MIQQYTKYKKVTNVVILWNMMSIHVVPDRQQYIGLRQAHMLYRIDNNMIGVILIVDLFKRIFDFVVCPSNCHVVIILCDVGGGVPLA